MKHAILTMTLSAMSLAGCGFTASGDTVRATAAERGAKAMDLALINAEWFICSAVSVGAVRRRYGRAPELADAYETLCRQDIGLHAGQHQATAPCFEETSGQSAFHPPPLGVP